MAAGDRGCRAAQFDQTLAAIAAHADTYAALLANTTDAHFRAEVTGTNGTRMSRGALIVGGVLASCVAYRMQLFLYLKASGREELNTMNLWGGVDAARGRVMMAYRVAREPESEPGESCAWGLQERLESRALRASACGPSPGPLCGAQMGARF